MSLAFDHAIIAVNDLDVAIQDYRDLGFTVIRGGIHANQATKNAIIAFLDGTYLELLSETGAPPIPEVFDFSPLLQKGEGLVGFALRSDDLDVEVARLRTNQFSVSDVLRVERRTDDGKVIQGNLALLDNGFAPFLIEDVTPREWRIPNDTVSTTHLNRAVGLKGIELKVDSIEPSWEKYVRLFGFAPKYKSINRRSIGGVILYEFTYNPDSGKHEYPDYLRMFAGSVSEVEIDAANPDLEPRDFKKTKERKRQEIEEYTRSLVQEKTLDASAIAYQKDFYAIHLLREQIGADLFTPARTHYVRFRQFAAAAPTRGQDILVGLNNVDWASLHHAYGPATDVPDLLRALASDDDEIRGYAYERMLNGNIVHQGSVFEASPEIIPFLMQLLNASEVQDKSYLLDLLEAIAHGGMREPELQNRIRTLLDEALPILLAQFNHTDPKIRSKIASQLLLFPSEIITLEPLLKTKIASETSPFVRAACVMSLADLWMSSKPDDLRPKLNDEQTAYFADLMRDSSQILAVQLRAARILVRDNSSTWLDEVITLFYRMMDNDIDVLKSLDDVWLGGIFHDLINALPENPDKALEWIIAQAKHPHSEIRECVPNALQWLIRANQPIDPMIAAVTPLLSDPSPDVRQHAVGFFYREPYTINVIDRLKDMAVKDPSLHVRVVARNAMIGMSK